MKKSLKEKIALFEKWTGYDSDQFGRNISSIRISDSHRFPLIYVWFEDTNYIEYTQLTRSRPDKVKPLVLFGMHIAKSHGNCKPPKIFKVRLSFTIPGEHLVEWREYNKKVNKE